MQPNCSLASQPLHREEGVGWQDYIAKLGAWGLGCIIIAWHCNYSWRYDVLSEILEWNMYAGTEAELGWEYMIMITWSRLFELARRGACLLLLVTLLCKRTFLFEDRSSLLGPSLKMAANPSPEVKAITMLTHDLMLALSNEPLGVAGLLLSKGFISGEIMSKMLVVSYTPTEKATILIEATRNKVELAPSRFEELLDILSEQVCAKEVVEGLRSTYQSELT